MTLLGATQSSAQADYPSSPIRLVVTSAAGGTGDTLARAVSRLAERDLNANIVVDNRPGANGIIATDAVAKAEPNGYTLLQTSSSMVTNAATGRKLPYDVTRDFIPVTNLATAEGYLVLVNPGLKVESVKELIALATNKNLLYGSPGPGNPIHFMTESLNQRAVANAVNSEELRSYMQNGGYIPDGRSPAEFRALVLSDYKQFRELARVANIKEE